MRETRYRHGRLGEGLAPLIAPTAVQTRGPGEIPPLNDVLYGDADCRLIGRRSLFSKVTIALYRGDETQAIPLSIMNHDAKAAARMRRH